MKRIITIVVIVLICVGFAFFLFKLSPQPISYALDTSAVKQLTDPAPFDPNIDHYKGNPNAKNVFIEYGDLQCPACRSFEPTMKDVQAQFQDTVFVYRYYPLVQIHKNAVVAALAAEAANAQGKFWEFHDKLYEKQPDWENSTNPIDQFTEYAKEVGVSNIDQFKKDIQDQKYKSRIERDNNESLGLGLQGTPTLYFNNHQLQAQADVNALKTQVEPFINK